MQLHEHEVTDMVRQAERADYASLQHLAHSIKGGAATLGLCGLAGVAKQLEDAASEGTPHPRLVELARTLEAEHAELSRLLARASDGHGAALNR